MFVKVEMKQLVKMCAGVRDLGGCMMRGVRRQQGGFEEATCLRSRQEERQLHVKERKTTGGSGEMLAKALRGQTHFTP